MKAKLLIITSLTILVSTFSVCANQGNSVIEENATEELKSTPQSFYFSNHQVLTNSDHQIESTEDIAELTVVLKNLKTEFSHFPATHPLRSSIDKDILALEAYISQAVANLDVDVSNQLTINE